MKSVRITIEGDNIRNILDLIFRKENISYEYKTKDVVILMEEEYYVRIKSNLLAVYIFNFKDERMVEIEMVSGGGKSDWDFDWGAESSESKKIVHSIIEICNQNSWSIIEIFPEEFKLSLEKSAVKNFLESILPWFKK